ncbi:MAG: hypothetical protein ACR2FV_03810 [Ornithinimicrobium sp.]|uniref:hypothetical protein n=1 Tax=Ornithinimicrobium sp. TaxID=1977084 RepID=UPI0017C19408|nr:hypothetical protein [Actinomycetota bacterium]
MVDGIHLRRSKVQRDQIARLGERVGPPVGLAGVLDGLNRVATPARVPGRAPVWGFTWNDQDQGSPRWWPQGISSTADATASGQVQDRRLLVTSWYCKDDGDGRQGSRVTFVDLETLRYRHVLLVRAVTDEAGGTRLEPLHIHAGGVVWAGDHLHVAGTRRGFFTCRISDIIRLEPGPESFDYRYVLPVRFTYRAHAADEVEPLRYSFLSLNRSSNPPELVAGEYGRGDMSTRLVRYPLDEESLLPSDQPDGRCQPALLDPRGVGHMQGVAVVGERYYVSVSRGRTRRGHLYVGAPGSLTPRRWALPPGPEDICYWPSTDQLWSLSEYPGRRFVFAMDRANFD